MSRSRGCGGEWLSRAMRPKDMMSERMCSGHRPSACSSPEMGGAIPAQLVCMCGRRCVRSPARKPMGREGRGKLETAIAVSHLVPPKAGCPSHSPSSPSLRNTPYAIVRQARTLSTIACELLQLLQPPEPTIATIATIAYPATKYCIKNTVFYGAFRSHANYCIQT